MEFMGPFTFNAVTFFIGAASLIPVILIFDKTRPDAAARKQLWKYGFICGLVLFGASALQQVGVDLTNSAGKSGFITGLYIIFVPIAGIFMKRSAGMFTWIGAVFAVAGMYFLCVQNGLGGLTPGDWALFVGTFFWTAHIIVVDRFAPFVNALRLSQVQFIICGVLCAVIAFFLPGEALSLSILRAGLIPLLYRGLGSVGIAYTLQVIGQRHVAPAKASVIFSLESVFSAIGGAILIREVMTGRAYFGCALIFCGILLSQIRPRSKEPAQIAPDPAQSAQNLVQAQQNSVHSVQSELTESDRAKDL
ncbi:transporter [Clostridia bacterium]|nr:transporter [Clostridia bacterium]